MSSLDTNRNLMREDDGKQVVSVEDGKHMAYSDEGKHATPSDEGKYFVAVRSSIDVPEPVPAMSPQYVNNGFDGHINQPQPIAPQKKSRRKLYWILGALLLVVVVLAAVLGGVLGSRNKSKESSSGTPISSNSTNGTADNDMPRPIKLTSLAATTGSDTDKLLLYYQSRNGSIIEATYNISALTTTTNGSLVENWNYLPVTADSQTALAAATWTNLGTTTPKHVLLFTKGGYVAQVNRTGTSSWTDQSTVSNATMSPHSRALTTCFDPVYIGGGRTYYGSAEGYVRQLTYSISNDDWFPAWPFYGTDPNTGISCTLQKSDKITYWNIYMRNTSTSALTQTWWSFPEPKGLTKSAWPVNDSPYTIPEGANITAVFDGNNGDSVAVSSPNGTVSIASAVPHEKWLPTANALPAGIDSSTLMASWNVEGTGVVWVFQDENGDIRAMTMDGSVDAIIV